MHAVLKLESAAFAAVRSFAGPLLLVAAISLGYAAEMLFQPDVPETGTT
ncbi:MAG: hypothetical protein ABI330_17865 [Caldimonas sp.]|nr:hypothetical protein [Pseudomonadota bacterium]